MIDHVTVRVDDLEESKQFYALALERLGAAEPFVSDAFVEWNDFSIAPASPERESTRRLHVGFQAPSREAVDRWWQAMTAPGTPTTARPARDGVRADVLRSVRHRSGRLDVEAVHIRPPRGDGTSRSSGSEWRISCLDPLLRAAPSRYARAAAGAASTAELLHPRRRADESRPSRLLGGRGTRVHATGLGSVACTGERPSTTRATSAHSRPAERSTYAYTREPGARGAPTRRRRGSGAPASARQRLAPAGPGFALATRDPGNGLHAGDPDSSTYTSHDGFAGDSSKAGSATNQTVAAARPRKSSRSGSAVLGARSLETATSDTPYAGLAADTSQVSAGSHVGSPPVRGTSAFVLRAIRLRCGPRRSRGARYASSSLNGYHLSRRYFVTTFGCQMNAHDSERIKGMLESLGLGEAPEAAQADVLVFNTCTIREKPDTKLAAYLGDAAARKRRDPGSRRRRRRLLRRGPARAHLRPLSVRRRRLRPRLDPPSRRLADGGWLRRAAWAVRHARDVRRHAADAPRASRQRLGAGLDGLQLEVRVLHRPGRPGPRTEPTTGRDRRRGRRLARDGVREITLLGQNVNSWGRDLAPALVTEFGELLRACDAVAGIERIRFTSPHPKDFREPVIAAMADCASVCEHVHLPLQSGSVPGAEAHAPHVHPRAVPRARRAAARRDSRSGARHGHHRRLPRRDRGGLRRDARGRRGRRIRERVHVRLLASSGNGGGRAGRADPGSRQARADGAARRASSNAARQSGTAPASGRSRRCSSRVRAARMQRCCAGARAGTRRSTSPARPQIGELVDVVIEGSTSTTLRGRERSLLAA